MPDNFLNETILRNLVHARDPVAAWMIDYNTARSHSALGYQTPAGFALNLTTAIALPAARDEKSPRRAVEFTPSSDGDSPVLRELLDQMPECEEICTVTSDGAHDTCRGHTAIHCPLVHVYTHESDRPAGNRDRPIRKSGRP